MHPTDCTCAECRGVVGPGQSELAKAEVYTRTGMDRHVELYGGPFDGMRFRVEALDGYLWMPAALPTPYKAQSKFVEALERLEEGRSYRYVRVDVEISSGVNAMQRNSGGRVMYRLFKDGKP